MRATVYRKPFGWMVCDQRFQKVIVDAQPLEKWLDDLPKEGERVKIPFQSISADDELCIIRT